MGTAFLYGNGGGGGTGAALTVTAPAGCTVTVSKDGKTKTKVAGADGVAVFRGLATGQWTVTITDGEQTAQKTVTITADYSTAITFFAATIHVTYPAGSICTATDGVTTLLAPDTSGTWDCAVPNAGTWTVKFIKGDTEIYSKDVDISESGEFDVSPIFLYIYGDECTDITGGWSKPIASQGTFTKNTNNMTLKGQSGICFGYIGTGNKIEPRSTLYVEITVSGYNNESGYFGVKQSKTDGAIESYIAKTVINKNISKDVLSLSISAVTYPVYATFTSGGNSVFCIHRVWME